MSSNWLLIVKNRKTSLFRAYSICYGAYKYMPFILERPFSSYRPVLRKQVADVYINKTEIKEFQKILSKKLINKPKFIQKHLQKYKNLFNKLERFSKEISKINFEEYTNSRLSNTFKKYSDNYQKLVPFMFTPHLFQSVLEQKIQDFLKLKNSQQSIFSDISIPYYQTFEIVQQKEMLKIAQKIFHHKNLKIAFRKKKSNEIIAYLKCNHQNIIDLLQEHIEKWAWIGMDDYQYKDFSIQDLIEVIQNNLNTGKDSKKMLENIERNQKQMYKKAKIIVKKQKLSKQELVLVTLLQKYIWLRTARLEAFRKGFFYTKPLILEIAKRAALSKNQVYSLTPKEIITFLKNGNLPDKRIVKRRIKGYVVAMIDGKIKLYSGPQWPPYFEKKMGLRKVKASNIIEGRTACRGKVKGRVKIVLSREDINRVKKGDILVTTMTNPEYMIAMHKASAIVTDEGGITCHAAIISREFKIPCIVGTGHATQILKDGDLVEVDATKGIVRKI